MSGRNRFQIFIDSGTLTVLQSTNIKAKQWYKGKLDVLHKLNNLKGGRTLHRKAPSSHCIGSYYIN